MPDTNDPAAIQTPQPPSDVLAWPPTDVPFARPVSSPYFGVNWRQNPFLLPDLPRRAAWVDLGLAAVLVLVLDMLSGMVLRAWLVSQGEAPVEGEWTPEMQKRALVPGLVARSITTLLVVGFIARIRGQRLASLGIPMKRWGTDIGIGIAAVVVVYGLIAVLYALMLVFWPEMVRQMSRNAELLRDLVPPLPIGAFVFVALLIGLYEELLFRGFLMPRLRRATGSWWWAVILSTVVFTALHAVDQTPAALIIVTVLSLAFSGLTIWRRSIVPAIVAHALFDWSQFVLLSSTT